MSEINIILELVAEIDVAGVEVDIRAFRYQGFDPETVLRHFIDVRSKRSISQENFKLDLRSLIAAGIVMGNVTDRNIEKISKEGKDKLNKLYVKYGLKKGGVGRQRDAITLPRIMSTFPILASKCLAYTTPRSYGNELGCSNLPDCMKLSVFPSLIPLNFNINIKKILLTLSAAYTTEQSIAISDNDNENGDQPDVGSIFMKQYDFATISHKSSYPSNEDRVDYFRSLVFHYDKMNEVYEIIVGKVNHMFHTKIEFPELKTFVNLGMKMEEYDS